MAKQARKESHTAILQAFKELVAEHGLTPDVQSIIEKSGVTLEDFDKLFTSPEDVAKSAWLAYGEAVIEQLEASGSYQEYGVREKIMAYLFTFFEQVANDTDRAFIRRTWHTREVIKPYHTSFKALATELVQEGIAMDELKERFSLSQKYPDMLWNLHRGLIKYWLHDKSEDYVQTERAIETYSKLPLEFMGHNIFDSIADTVKFEFEKLNLDKALSDLFSSFNKK